MGEGALGALFLKAAQQAAEAGECTAAKAPPVLKHAKLVLETRDQAAAAADGAQAPASRAPRSAGFGFVEFAEHAHALAALKRLAFNAKALAADGKPPPKRGLFVEFALDDTRKLELQRQRRERARSRSRGGGVGEASAGQLAAKWQMDAPRADADAGGRGGGGGARGRGRGGAAEAGRGRGRGAAEAGRSRTGGAAEAGRGRGGGGARGGSEHGREAGPPRTGRPDGASAPARGGGRPAGAQSAGRVPGVPHEQPPARSAAVAPRAGSTAVAPRGVKRPTPSAQPQRAGTPEPQPERHRKVRKASEDADDRAFDKLVAKHKKTLTPVASGLRDWMEA